MLSKLHPRTITVMGSRIVTSLVGAMCSEPQLCEPSEQQLCDVSRIEHNLYLSKSEPWNLHT